MPVHPKGVDEDEVHQVIDDGRVSDRSVTP